MTVNSGVVSYVNDSNEIIEYYDVIEEIIEISFEGNMDLSLVFFVVFGFTQPVGCDGHQSWDW